MAIQGEALKRDKYGTHTSIKKHIISVQIWLFLWILLIWISHRPSYPQLTFLLQWGWRFGTLWTTDTDWTVLLQWDTLDRGHFISPRCKKYWDHKSWSLSGSAPGRQYCRQQLNIWSTLFKQQYFPEALVWQLFWCLSDMNHSWSLKCLFHCELLF